MISVKAAPAAQVDRHTERDTQRHTDRQTDRQTEILAHTDIRDL